MKTSILATKDFTTVIRTKELSHFSRRYLVCFILLIYSLAVIIPCTEYTLSFVLLKIIMAILFAVSLHMGISVDCSFFSPFTLFATYPLAILFYSDYLSDRYLPIPTLAGATVVSLAGISVFGGMLVMRSFFYDKEKATKRYNESQNIDYSALAMFVIFLIPISMSFLRGQGIDYTDLNSSEIRDARAEARISIIGTLFAFYVPLIIQLVVKKSKWIIVVYGLILFYSLITLSKGTIIDSVVVLLFAFNRYKTIAMVNGKSTFKYIFTFVVLILVILYAFRFYAGIRSGNFFNEKYRTEYEYAELYQNVNSLPEFLQGLYLPYMYITTPTSNTCYLVENHRVDGNGYATLWPILSTFQIKRLLNIERPGIPIRLDPYNTSSLGGVFYYDGGWPLVLAGCFVLGFLTYFFYVRSISSKDIIYSAEYFFWGLALFYSFFSNHFILVASPLRNFVIFELYRYIISLFKR